MEHPYLSDPPLLYISGIPPHVSDESIALAFANCGPFRPRINRDGSNALLSGTIEFKMKVKAEQALATLQAQPIPNLHPPVLLALSPFPPGVVAPGLPYPQAIPRLVKHLPPDFSDSALFELFRAYGPLMAAHRHTHFGPDTGVVEYFSEDHAQAAEEALHCADIEGSNIAVQIYQPRRTVSGGVTEFNTNAPSFVPASASMGSYPAQYSPSSPPRGIPYRSPRQSVSSIVHGPGQQVQVAPPGSSHSGLIDPCNLFCKNLDPDIDSNALFAHFRQFGQIVSARVMRNENGESRGFGFVSFQTPEQANNALHAMNGAVIGAKQIVVRLHEPKQLRQEKLAQRFSGGRPRNSSGATSPTASEGGESFAGWQSPRLSHSQLGSPTHERPDRGRRGSGSYYNAALAGTLNVSLHFDDLASLSPVVRKEILAGELSRRVKALGTVPSDEVDSVVERLSGLSLGQIVETLESQDRLEAQVHSVQSKDSSPQESSRSPSADASQTSSLQDPNYLNATASAPEHPSTPISISASSTPPRTSSPSGSVPPVSERDRMLAAVSKLESSKQEELTELLMSLPKRDRAMCLFNTEILRAKLADAKVILESDDEVTPAPAIAPPVTPKQNKTASRVPEESPRTPDLSSRGPSAAASPVPSTPGNHAHSAASLAKLSAAEIVRIATTTPAASLPFGKADTLVVKATDEFVDSLSGFSMQLQKQKLGDKLFKVIKAFGIKGAPKITIALLDEEELRPLAHLMNSYPSVLKEKALQIQANGLTK
jgi:polyadenylate-binding protein